MKSFYLGLLLIFLFKFNAHSQNTEWSTSPNTNIGIGISPSNYPLELYNSTARSVSSGVYTDFGFETYSNTDWQGSRLYFGRARGTIIAPSAVQNNDSLGWLDFYGSDGTLMRRAGQIVFKADGTPSSGIVPGMVVLCTVGADGVNTERFRVNSLGNVGIGTTDTKGYKLGVNGSIHSKSVVVDLIGWSDYVFKKDYQLPTLAEVKAYITQNQHLPDMPSEAEVIKNGVDLGEMNKLLLKKVEELTLYLIQKDKKEKEQETINQRNAQQLEQLKAQLESLIKAGKQHSTSKLK
jgi:hypothetical protein